jgi:mRNA-degrading endonuclease toxin of MazEF toxin-antitoxin module
VPLPGSLGVTGVILTDQIRRVSWVERGCELIIRAPPEVLDDVREKLATP